MKFIIFFIFIPLAYSELHSFITTYTAIHGETAAGTPEFSAVSTLDDHQIDYYDSEIKKLIPRQDWMKKFTSTEMWTEDTEIRQHVEQIYRNNIHVIMQRFNQSHGVHTYQRMYGCEYDDETGDSHGFDEYAYDGEDFISLDLKENRYIASVAQGITTAQKWNNDREQLEYLKQYYNYECVYWLKEFLHLSKATFEKTEPEVSLLQKNSDYYTCHVTGFLFRNTSVFWRKNGQALSVSSNLVKSGDTLPNEDGTFQRTFHLYVLPEERKKNKFSCVVDHKSLTETIQQILTEDQIKRNKPASDASYIISWVPVILIVTVGLIGLFVLWKLRKKLKADRNKKPIYVKTKPSQDPAQESLLSRRDHHLQELIKFGEDFRLPRSSRDEQRFLLRDEQYLFPESSPSQFLTDGPIFSSPPTTESFYKVQETSKDL